MYVQCFFSFFLSELIADACARGKHSACEWHSRRLIITLHNNGVLIFCQ